MYFFFFSSRRRHTRFSRDWSSDVCSSDLFITDVDLFLLYGFSSKRANNHLGRFHTHFVTRDMHTGKGRINKLRSINIINPTERRQLGHTDIHPLAFKQRPESQVVVTAEQRVNRTVRRSHEAAEQLTAQRNG